MYTLTRDTVPPHLLQHGFNKASPSTCEQHPTAVASAHRIHLNSFIAFVCTRRHCNSQVCSASSPKDHCSECVVFLCRVFILLANRLLAIACFCDSCSCRSSISLARSPPATDPTTHTHTTTTSSFCMHPRVHAQRSHRPSKIAGNSTIPDTSRRRFVMPLLHTFRVHHGWMLPPGTRCTYLTHISAWYQTKHVCRDV